MRMPFASCWLALVLCQACNEDAVLGRMTSTRELSMEDIAEFNLSPRFGVEQGKFMVAGFACEW